MGTADPGKLRPESWGPASIAMQGNWGATSYYMMGLKNLDPREGAVSSAFRKDSRLCSFRLGTASHKLPERES